MTTTAAAAPVDDRDGPPTPTEDAELIKARELAHQLERFTWLMRGRASTDEQDAAAGRANSLAVGLRRMLDRFGGLNG